MKKNLHLPLCIHLGTQTVPCLPHNNGTASLSDDQGPTSAWQFQLEYPTCKRTIFSQDGTVQCSPSRGQYHRLPVVGWELGLDLGQGWREIQGDEDDPTQDLLRRWVWMVPKGLR